MITKTSLLTRLLADGVFWVLANLCVYMAARNPAQFVAEDRGRMLFLVVNVLWIVPIIGDSYVRASNIDVVGMSRWYYLTMCPLLVSICGCTYEYTRAAANSPQPRDRFFYAGVILIATGFAISMAAWLTIRRYSSPRMQIVQGHRLVASGLYKVIRHPICLSFFVIATGIVVLFRSVIGGVLVAVLVAPAWLYILGKEEFFLLSYFGAAYETYRQRTKRLLPFLY